MEIITRGARRNCNNDDDDDDDDHNSRLVLRPILGQLNDLVAPSTSYHLLRLPVNYQSRCLSFSLPLSLPLHVAACCAVRKRCVTEGERGPFVREQLRSKLYDCISNYD